MFKEFGHREADVFGDLTQKSGRNVSPRMEWNSRGAAISVPELLVRTTLPHFNKAKFAENCHRFGRL